MRIRALIVDDERLARERLRGLLETEPGVEVIGECSDGREAVEVITREKPDLVFLDVQMPELDGFGVVKALPKEGTPAIIFVTAHDKFAVRAFEVHALDYLLKPFDKERFKASLGRAIAQIQRREPGELSEKLSALLLELKPESGKVDRIAVKADGRVLFFKADEIDWIEAADNYVNLHVGQESHLHRETMNSIEKKLPGRKFLRISRSTIVNVERIKELQPLFHGDYVVILRGGAKLTLSRNYRDKLNQLLGKTD